MWVLTEGWYDDMTVKGVTSDEGQAKEWEDSDQYREAHGPYVDGWPTP
jgi:hypothetical protein